MKKVSKKLKKTVEGMAEVGTIDLKARAIELHTIRLEEMFSSKLFSMCTVNDCAEALGIEDFWRSDTKNTIRPYHCMPFTEMGDETKMAIKHLIFTELFSKKEEKQYLVK